MHKRYVFFVNRVARYDVIHLTEGVDDREPNQQKGEEL